MEEKARVKAKEWEGLLPPVSTPSFASSFRGLLGTKSGFIFHLVLDSLLVSVLLVSVLLFVREE